MAGGENPEGVEDGAAAPVAEADNAGADGDHPGPGVRLRLGAAHDTRRRLGGDLGDATRTCNKVVAPWLLFELLN